MQWPNEVFAAKFIKRYKRFFVDIEIENVLHQAHVANTGSLKSCLSPGQDCLVSKAKDPNRKLKFSLHALKMPNGNWVGVDTSLPNQIVFEAVKNKVFSHWKDFDLIEKEKKISPQSRLDFCLIQTKNERRHFIEVKNVTYCEGETALFPDAVTTRGLKHLNDLIALQDSKTTCEILFLIQRNDVNLFSPAWDIDPEYAQGLKNASDRGVMITPVIADISEDGVKMRNERIKFSL